MSLEFSHNERGEGISVDLSVGERSRGWRGRTWVCKCGVDQTDAERQVGEAVLDSP